MLKVLDEACAARCTSAPMTCLGCVACDIRAEVQAVADDYDVEVLW